MNAQRLQGSNRATGGVAEADHDGLELATVVARDAHQSHRVQDGAVAGEFVVHVEDVDVERVTREIKILKMARHPNIIQLYEIIETPRQLYLITEYVPGGELFDYIVKHHRLSEAEACKFFQQIMSAIVYLHELGIVH